MGVIRARRGVRAVAEAAPLAQARGAGLPRGRVSGLAFELGGTPSLAGDSGLTVSKPSDPAEREADALAARVLSGTAAQADPGLHQHGKPTVQRECAACAEEDDEKKAGATKGTVNRHGEGDVVVTPAVAQALRGMAGAGAPLPESERRFFEGRFGYELSRVRIHDDPRAAETARDLNAHAFTFGNDVAFAAGRYRPDTAGGRRLLAHELAHVVQQGSASPLLGGAALPVRSGGAAVVARKADTATEGAAPAAEPASPVAGGLVVEDDALTLLSGQIRKSAFLGQLRQAGCAAADEVLVRAGRSTAGCPYLEKALAFYAERPAGYVERAARKMVGGANVRSAAELVPLVAGRMAAGVETWLATGSLPRNLPDELQAAMPGGGGAATSAGAEAASGGGGVSFKDGPGGANRGTDPTALAARLGPGRPLDGSTRVRMESAFGESLGGVRIHDDPVAAGASRDLNARAFALGSHVAFSRDSYRPGTPVGDALLAHELAHVVQQGGAAARSPAGKAGARVAAEPTLALEQDADTAAAGVVAALWGGGKRARSARPHGRTGLSLQRCPDGDKADESKAEAQKPEAKKPEAVKATFGTVETLVNNIKACDGGTGIWEAAKLGNGKKEPTITAGTPRDGLGGVTDSASGEITILTTLNTCKATQILMHELSNLARLGDFNQIISEAKEGDVSRDDFIRRIERIEYEAGVVNALKSFNACKPKWGCAPGTVGNNEAARGVKSFDEYLKLLKAAQPDHMEGYGRIWDEKFKAKWKAKHP
jgi:hypothetical protein